VTENPNRLLDEVARLFNDAASVAQGVQREATSAIRSQMERFVGEMDLVRREDFDAVREMASRARMENAALAERIAALEQQVAQLAKGGPKTMVAGKDVPPGTVET
jgi:BMFP domain-containing protein YqiC